MTAGTPLPDLNANELAMFAIGKADVAEAEGAEDGLGPTMNLDSCGGCHERPALGGSSPLVNPPVAFAAKLSATDAVPSFINVNGPVREARCHAKRALGSRGRGNLVVPSQTISAQPNRSGNDGTLGRFGWKAQNKSLMIFAGEADNVEMGITNDLFPTERHEAPECQYATLPNSVTHLDLIPSMEAISSIEKFTIFMRLPAPLQASTDRPGGASSVSAGNAPLWGLGQRQFFLHDGRTADLVQAVLAHRGEGSEANGGVAQFTRPAEREQQDLLNFLRSL